MLLSALLLMTCLAPAALAAEPPAIPIEPLPAEPPAWLAGYRVRYPLRVADDLAAQPAKSVIARLPTGGWLKPDGSDIAVQTAAGQQIPVTVLSHDPNGDTIIQLPRSADDRWYWAYASNPAAPPANAPVPAQEGLIAEFRDWSGDTIDTWANVVDGLKKSDNVIGNAPVAEIISNFSPARPHDPRHYAASYRGFLKIETAGAYRLLVNAQDAVFLFINGQKVFERGGQNERLTGKIPVSTSGTLMDLAAGVHPFEIHHVVGDNQASFGFCAMLWVPPGETNWAYVPPAAFAQSLYATVGDVQEAGGGQAATFGAGVDDVLATLGQTLYLVRFEAQGSVKDPAQLTWDFGDGTTGTGRSVTHVYFKEGPYLVKLQSSPGLPPAQRTVHAWSAPVNSSPFSLENAVRSLAASNWAQLDLPRLKQAFSFLLVCEQPDRWPLLEAISRHLLTVPGTDPEFRATTYSALMESLARQGKGDQALELVKPALEELARARSLQVKIKLAEGDVHFRHLRDIDAASQIYQTIIEKNRRLAVPEVRMAAIRLGDLYTETGDMPQAAEAYRLAGTLGGAAFDSTAQADAVTRGAMLRIAEQRLRAGDIRETRQLMEKIELNYPEQKLEGLYRFLRAEADRIGRRYEDAIDSYELMMKLPQWAGYRSKALYGIADSYVRSGDDDKALEWLDTLEESFPAYYEEQKLDAYRRTIEVRTARTRAAAASPAGAGQGRAVAFAGFSTSFEPDDPLIADTLTGCTVVPGLGMGGSHIGLIEAIPVTKGYAEGTIRLRNIKSGGYHWVELWYRESLNSLPANSHMHTYLQGTGTDQDPVLGMATNYYSRTYGEWRKLGFLLRAPLTQDGRVLFTIRQVHGVTEFDSLSVMPISDRQYDAMLNFAQRSDPE